jgi:hypothetical protein
MNGWLPLFFKVRIIQTIDNNGDAKAGHIKAATGCDIIDTTCDCFIIFSSLPFTYFTSFRSVFITMLLNWQLKGDTSLSRMFLGSDCGFCKDTLWKVESKNFIH